MVEIFREDVNAAVVKTFTVFSMCVPNVFSYLAIIGELLLTYSG